MEVTNKFVNEEEIRDGWYIVQDDDSEFWYWSCYDKGKLLMSCSDKFKTAMLSHPKVIEEYKKYLKKGN